MEEYFTHTHTLSTVVLCLEMLSIPQPGEKSIDFREFHHYTKAEQVLSVLFKERFQQQCTQFQHKEKKTRLIQQIPNGFFQPTDESLSHMAGSTTSARKVLISRSQEITNYLRATSWHVKLSSLSCSQNLTTLRMECIVQTLKGFTRLIVTLSRQWFAGSGKQTGKQIMRSQISWSYEKSRYCLHSNYPGSITVRIVLKEKLVSFLWGQKWVRNYNYLPYLFPWELKYFL